MIIIYGVMCDCSILERQRSLDDVWLALSMLPHLRWRWERKDMQGMHPIISKIAEKVFKVNFSQIKEEYSPGALIPEIPTSEYDAAELRPQSALKGKMGRWSANSSPVPQGGAYDSQRSPVVSSSSSALMAPGLIHRPTPQLASSMQPWPEPLVGLFYPFDQENPANLQRWPNYPQGSSGHPDAPSSVPPEVSMPPGSPTFYRSMGAVGCQPGQQSFINEENDKTPPPEMNNIDGLLDMVRAAPRCPPCADAPRSRHAGWTPCSSRTSTPVTRTSCHIRGSSTLRPTCIRSSRCIRITTRRRSITSTPCRCTRRCPRAGSRAPKQLRPFIHARELFCPLACATPMRFLGVY